MTTSIGKGLHLHFDPCSGVAGDMTVAALVDAGVPEKVVIGAIRAMGLPGLKVGFERRRRGAFVGLGFTVNWPGKGEEHAHHHDHGHDHGHDHEHSHAHAHSHEHRDYAEIRRLLRKAALEPEVKKLAGEIFERIAEAEAALHGVSVDKVAFHEVGAWDSVADIVGAAAALAWLDPVDVTSTPPVVGSGTIHTAHGLMPVPAPATAALLRGLPVLTDGKGELTTPTGAAILATVVRSFGPPPPLRLRAQGFGAGTRELADRPNVLRVMLGEVVGQALPASASEVVLVAANIDDMNPQLAEPLMTALFAAGAMDVWFTPILMKKGRPALEVSALCPGDVLAVVEQAFFANSTTIGLRRQVLNRTVLDRSLAKVATAYGDVRVKVSARDGEILGATPEFEDCRKLALRAKVPVRTVMAEAVAAALVLLHPSRAKRGRK
jgi:uncharacterized protein (TIGR00299 family) protein